MSGVYCWFVVLQLNDVDALIWVLAYGAVAVISALAALPKGIRLVTLPALVLGIIFALWGIWLFRQTTGRWWDGEVEREVGGLFISALWTTALSILSRRLSRSD